MSTDTETPDTVTTLTNRMVRSALASVLTSAAVLGTTLGALVLYFAPVLEIVGGGDLELEAVAAASVIGLCLASLWIGAVVGTLRVTID